MLEREQQGKQLAIQPCHNKSLDRWIAERHYLGYVPCGARLRLWVLNKRRDVIGAIVSRREVDI
jgi:hypothetical protein